MYSGMLSVRELLGSSLTPEGINAGNFPKDAPHRQLAAMPGFALSFSDCTLTTAPHNLVKYVWQPDLTCNVLLRLVQAQLLRFLLTKLLGKVLISGTLVLSLWFKPASEILFVFAKTVPLALVKLELYLVSIFNNILLFLQGYSWITSASPAQCSPFLNSRNCSGLLVVVFFWMSGLLRQFRSLWGWCIMCLYIILCNLHNAVIIS